jgi:hypothetical protein
MTLEDAVKIYGAKGAVLDYISTNAPDVPIEPFVLVPVGDDWKKYGSSIDDLGMCLVRSSSPLEDGKKLSFAGLFDTTHYYGDYSVKQVLDSAADEDAIRYAHIHGVNTPLEMGLVFQRDSESGWNWGMIRHPHMDNLLLIMGRPVNQRYYSEEYVYDEKAGTLEMLNYFCLSRTSDLFKHEFVGMSLQLEQAIEQYRQIESLPAFQTGYAYHMEFGTHPVSVYQFRPFRKKEHATWNIDLSSFKDADCTSYSFGLCFGITEKEGIDLTLARALSTHHNEEHISRYREILAGRPHTKIVEGLLKGWKLSRQERAYAEEVAKINPHSYGYEETDAFNRAIARINDTMKKEETCLFQENLHYYTGKDIDLLFPNAKAWIASGGAEFISHNWFRAMQTYDICLASYTTDIGRTGDKVKVYSDGMLGAVIVAD